MNACSASTWSLDRMRPRLDRRHSVGGFLRPFRAHQTEDFRLGGAAAEVMAEVGITEDAARPSAVGAGKAPTLRGVQPNKGTVKFRYQRLEAPNREIATGQRRAARPVTPGAQLDAQTWLELAERMLGEAAARGDLPPTIDSSGAPP
jgi:hypothetical protein